MAALLRASSRVCRQFLSYTAKTNLSYLRNTQVPNALKTEAVYYVRYGSVRPFSDAVQEKEDVPAAETMSSDMDDERLPLDKRPSRNRIMSNVQYERMIQKLGTISTKGSLFQLFDSILAKGEHEFEFPIKL